MIAASLRTEPACDSSLTKATLSPAVARESCFSPGRPPRPGRCLPVQSGPGPDNIAQHSGALCVWGLRLPGGGRAPGAVPGRGPGGRQRPCQSTHERGAFGEPRRKLPPPPSLCPQGAPKEAAGPRHPTQRRKGPGRQLRRRRLGVTSPGSPWTHASRPLRHFSSAPGSSPCDKSQASCLPHQGWAAVTSSSEAKSQELAFVPESGASLGFHLRVRQPGRRVTGHPAQPEPALRTPSCERVGRLGLGPEAAVTAGRRCRLGGGCHSPQGPLPLVPVAFWSDPSASSCSASGLLVTLAVTSVAAAPSPVLRDELVSRGPEASGPGQQRERR